MNLIPEVAKLLDIELGEEFRIIDAAGFDYGVFRLGENYIEQKLRNDKWLLSYEHMIGAIVCGRLQVVKLPKHPLDETEKEYLLNMIRPWKYKVVSVTKYLGTGTPKEEFIQICYLQNGYKYYISLPQFKKGVMYRGMELERDYSLDDLDLCSKLID